MNDPKRRSIWFILALAVFMAVVVLNVSYAAEACEGITWPVCEGPPGKDGKDGIDGIDGVDGLDGQNGTNGIDGRDGATGAQGIPGVTGPAGLRGLTGEVPTKWRTETRHWYQEIKDVAAAQAAMQVYLPKDQRSRLTLGMSHLSATTGLSVGYAYMLDNSRNTALTIAVGAAGSETAVQGSFGFEFGGARKPPKQLRPVVDPGVHEGDIQQIRDEREALLVEYDSLLDAAATRIDELEAQLNKPVPKQRVIERIEQKPWMTDEKRARLQAVLDE